MDRIEKITENLKRRGFTVKFFHTAEEAASYLNTVIDRKTVGFGGSMTLRQMGLFESLSAHNTVYSHWDPAEGLTKEEARRKASRCDIFVSSVNAFSETGEMVNIDGNGSRIAGIVQGHEQVYLVVGKNKIVPTLSEAIDRARNVAAPANARKNRRTSPCTVTGKCEDCCSPERRCNAMLILMECMQSCRTEVILVDEELGF